jgi:hypothetical protein
MFDGGYCHWRAFSIGVKDQRSKHFGHDVFSWARKCSPGQENAFNRVGVYNADHAYEGGSPDPFLV